MAHITHRRIGGWLAVFVVSYATGMATTLAVNIHQMIGLRDFAASPDFSSAMIIASVILAVQTAIVVAVLWRLFRVHRPRTIRWTIAALWISPAIGRAAALAGTAGLIRFWTIRNPALFVAGVAAQALYAAGWTTYFLRSRRVAETYRGVDAADALADTFA